MLRPLVLLASLAHIALAASANSTLPVVDLGYVQQRATTFNSTTNLYTFNNIRFASPPLGSLRLRLPEQPVSNASAITDGSEFSNTACHQFITPEIAAVFPGFPAEGLELGGEDCLFLDVWVPANIEEGTKVPVLAWWFPGGYTIGSKDFYGTPEGLLTSTTEPFIFVTANYRLGALGWSAPLNGEVPANLGLHDVRAAMDWIATHIGAFGGDKDRITVMGDSAGATSIAHTLVSYGGEQGELPFQQAILQSPAWNPEAPTNYRDELFTGFKDAANCSDVDCLRSAPTSIIAAANKAIVSAQVGPGFGPVVDGEYIPDFFQNLLADGRAHKLKSIISSVTRFEGRANIYATSNDTSDLLLETLESTLPDAANATVQAILGLYPDDGSAQGGYNRAVDFNTDFTAACNVRWLADAYSTTPQSTNSSTSLSTDGAYRFIYDMPPASHGRDMSYTFMADGETNSTTAAMQSWITRYVLTGTPGEEWVKVGGGQAVWLNETGVGAAEDPWAVGNEVEDERCGFFAERRQWV